MQTSTILAISSLVLSISVFLIAQYKVWKSGDGAIDKALHGDSDALEQVAYKLKNRRWVVRFILSGNTRRDTVYALCLAWSTDLKPYTRALVFDALVSLVERGKKGVIIHELIKIREKFNLYHSKVDQDVFKERLEMNSSLNEMVENIQPKKRKHWVDYIWQ